MIPEPEYYRTREDGVRLFRQASTENLKIREIGTNRIYDEAIEPEGHIKQYEETDIPIENLEPDTEIQQKAEAYDIIVGGEQSESN